MAAPAVQTPGAVAAATTGTTVVPALPTGWAAGDIVVVVAMHEAAATLSISAGWSEIIPPESNAGISTAFWWRRMVGGDTAPTVTYSLTLTSTNHGAARCYRVNATIATGTPYEDATATAVGDVTAPVTAAIDTTGVDRLVACFIVADDDQGWTTAPPPAGWTREANPVFSATGDDSMFELIYRTEATATSVTSATIGTYVDVAGENTKSVTLAFLPAAGSAQSVTLVPATETDTAQALNVSGGPTHVTLTPATETDGAVALSITHAIRRTLTPATETDAAQTLSVTGGAAYPAFISGDGTLLGPGTSFEASYFVGPYVDGNGNLYTFTENDAGTFNPSARKSTDQGVTWAAVGTSPSMTDVESAWTAHDPANKTIHLIRQRSSGSIAHAAFRTSDHATTPDSWTSPVTVASPGTNPGNQSVALALRSNGHLLAFYRTALSGSDERIGWRKSTDAGATWGSETILDGTAGKSFTQVVAVVGEADKVHVAYCCETDLAIWHKSIDSADTVSAAEVVSDNAVRGTTTGDATPLANGGIVYCDDAGTERIFIAWHRDSDEMLVGAEIVDDGVPGAEETISDAAVYFNPTNQGTQQPAAALAKDGTNVYALYADASTHDVWMATRTAGTWGTDVELVDATDAMSIGANVLTHAGGKVLAFIFSVDQGVDSGDKVYYDQQALATSTSVTLTPATETDSAQALTVTKPIHKTLTAAVEADTAQALSITHIHLRTLTPAAETDTAQALVVTQPGGPISIVPATEQDVAQALSFTKTIYKTLIPAAELDAAVALDFDKPIVKTLTGATETDTAQVLDVTHVHYRDLTPALETDTAQALSYIVGFVQPASISLTVTEQATHASYREQSRASASELATHGSYREQSGADVTESAHLVLREQR